MSTSLIAAFTLNGISIGQLAIYLIIACAVVAIVLIALRQMGVAPPPWVIQILWVVAVVVIAIFAIRILMSMG